MKNKSESILLAIAVSAFFIFAFAFRKSLFPAYFEQAPAGFENSEIPPIPPMSEDQALYSPTPSLDPSVSLTRKCIILEDHVKLAQPTSAVKELMAGNFVEVLSIEESLKQYKTPVGMLDSKSCFLPDDQSAFDNFMNTTGDANSLAERFSEMGDFPENAGKAERIDSDDFLKLVMKNKDSEMRWWAGTRYLQKKVGPDFLNALFFVSEQLAPTPEVPLPPDYAYQVAAIIDANVNSKEYAIALKSKTAGMRAQFYSDYCPAFFENFILLNVEFAADEKNQGPDTDALIKCIADYKKQKMAVFDSLKALARSTKIIEHTKNPARKAALQELLK